MDLIKMLLNVADLNGHLVVAFEGCHVWISGVDERVIALKQFIDGLYEL